MLHVCRQHKTAWQSCTGQNLPTRNELSILREYVRHELRSARTPERIKICSELPFNETGKLLRRVLRDELAAEFE